MQGRVKEYDDMIERIQGVENLNDFNDITKMLGFEIENADSLRLKYENHARLANIYRGLDVKLRSLI